MKTVILKNAVPKLRAEMSKAILKKAVEAGAIVIRNHAVINIGSTFKRVHGTRGLSRIVFQEAESSDTKCWYDIGPTVVYGRIQELGGTIKPVRAKMLSWIDLDTGKRIFAKKVYIPPRPYLRPAVDNNRNEIEEAMKSVLRTAIIGAVD